MNWLEFKYASLVAGRCRNFKRVSDSVMQFSCPLCGDSRRHPRKARGYITEKHAKPWYTCHKCGASMPLHRFIEAVDVTLYDEYKLERVSAGMWRRSYKQPSVAAPAAVRAPSVAADVSGEHRDPLSVLLRVDTLGPSHRARVLCEKRMLPDLSRVYHCPRFYAWTNYALKAEKFSKNALYYDHPRLIIPFVRDGVLFAYQGRDYDPNSDNKYTTIRIDESVPKVYGLDRLQEGRAYALEGPIDSMFVRNSVAFAGGTHRVLDGLVDRGETVIVYDNEPRAPLTVGKIKSAIEDGYPVCIWPSHVVQKDVNDMVLAGIDVQKVIDDNTFRGLSASLALMKWRK